MSYQITDEEINKIINAKGEVRGVVFKTDRRFIFDKAGEEGVKRVEEELEKMNCPFSYEEEADNMSFYPVGMRTMSIVAISRAFNLDKDGIIEMGFNAPKFSLMIKFFMRYFLSPGKIFEKAGEIWGKHYTIGKLVPIEINEEEKYMKAHISDTELHPIFCDYLCGYFSSIMKMGLGDDAAGGKLRCSYEINNGYEFTIKW